MLKRTSIPYYSKVNQRLEAKAKDLARQGQMKEADNLLSMSKSMLFHAPGQTREERRLMTRDLISRL